MPHLRVSDRSSGSRGGWDSAAFVVAAAILLLPALSAIGAEVRGTVDSVDGGRVRVTVADASVVRLGDSATLGSGPSGAWQVVVVELGAVVVKPRGASTSPPRLGDTAVVHTGGSAGSSAEAWYEQGLRALRGEGGAADPAMAAMWFSKAAAAGHPRAQTRLGALLADGEGVVRDEAAARTWLTAAARQGDTEARDLLASLDAAPPAAPAATAPATSALAPRAAAAVPAPAPARPAPATLVLIRKKRYLGSAVQGNVTLDGTPWGRLRTGRYLTATLEPGPHLVQIQATHKPKKLSWTEMVQLAPGQRLYLLRKTTTSGKLRTEPISESEALELMRKYKLAGSR